MSLHKVDVRDGNIFKDDHQQGIICSNPLDGIRAEVAGSFENGLTLVQLQWKIKKPPDPTAPLELLKIELPDFFPTAVFIAGRRYESAGSPRPQEREKGFPYNTYYKFRILSPQLYDAAFHAKMPLVCWSREDCAFAVMFPKFVRLSNGRWPVFIQASGPGSRALLKVVLPDQIRVQRKPYGWFGSRSLTEVHKLNLSNEHLIEATFGLIAADTWLECVRRSAERQESADKPSHQLSPESLVDIVEKCLHYYDRVWDGRNHTHMHLPVKNVPAFESVEFKHSHVTDDITKLVLLRRLIGAGWTRLEAREQELLGRLARGDYLRAADGGSWHTTTFFKGAKLGSFTHHGTGFVGFPGGMATNVRRLYEYHELTGDQTIVRLADSGAQWLRQRRRKDGAWPAAVSRRETEEARGCVASTAESARAFLAAYRLGRKQELEIARDALAYVNREQSFFECRQYLRDVSPGEADGISAEACIHANIDLFAATAERNFLDHAQKWGYYALQWVRPFFFDEKEGPSFDGLSRSITPRIDLWGGMLVARALLRLGRVSGEQRWLRWAWRLVHEMLKLQERDGGLCETWFFDFPSGLESIHIEPTFVTDALVEFVLDAPDRRAALSEELSQRAFMLAKKFPPLQPIAPIQSPVTLSRTQPEFIISRTLRLAPVFCGPYSVKNRARRFAYRLFRLKPFRRLLWIAPAAKIVLNRYCAQPPITDLRRPDRMKMGNVFCESFDAGRQRCIYKSALHKLTLSLVGTGNNQEDLPASDIGIEIETTAGDLAVTQVRIDLNGEYAVQSVSADGIVISAAGSLYRLRIISGSVDGIIHQDDTLAFDISLSSDWNFFGRYQLHMRVERTGKAAGTQSNTH